MNETIKLMILCMAQRKDAPTWKNSHVFPHNIMAWRMHMWLNRNYETERPKLIYVPRPKSRVHLVVEFQSRDSLPEERNHTRINHPSSRKVSKCHGREEYECITLSIIFQYKALLHMISHPPTNSYLQYRFGI